jgi:inner membrane protease subunit 1
MFLRMLTKAATSVLKFCVAAHIVTEYGAEVTMTVGPSMMPTLSMAGDTLLIDRTLNLPDWVKNIAGLDVEPKVGDIVVAKSPTDSTQTVCKRVIALSGQKTPSGKTVPPGRVWLEGDNKLNSTDSRDYGAVPLALIEGKVICRIWPPSKAGLLQPPSAEKSKKGVL